MASHLARIGVAVFSLAMALALVTEHPAAGRAFVAGATTIDLPSVREIAPVAPALPNVAVAGSETTPATISDVPEVPAAAVVPTAPESAPVVAVVPASAQPGLAVILAPVGGDAIVLASWYGPGFFGNRTACGQVYSPELLGVAHRTLPCGTSLTLTYGSRSIAVPVIDRGPFITGRTLDLSSATKIALGCTDLCTLRMQIRQ